eukprot:906522-Lingulodinium_polyedra.AAC.1
MDPNLLAVAICRTAANAPAADLGSSFSNACYRAANQSRSSRANRSQSSPNRLTLPAKPT